jgi:DNA-binding NarL/FixJ family response regulator
MTRAADGLPLTVVIADDSEAVAEMLRELLTEPGRVEVVGVTDTQASTVEMIRSLAPDAVVLDLQLRTGSGTDVIRAVRAEPELGGTQLLVTSNHASDRMRSGCLELGADGYYDKVKELGELALRLRDMAGNKERQTT